MNNTVEEVTVVSIDDAYAKVMEHCQIRDNFGTQLMKSLSSLSAKGFEVTNITLSIRQGGGFDDTPVAYVVLYNGKYHAMVYPNGFTCFGYYSNKYDSQIINFMNTIIPGGE